MFHNRSKSQGKCGSFGKALDQILSEFGSKDYTCQVAAYEPIVLELWERSTNFAAAAIATLRRCQQGVLECLMQAAVQQTATRQQLGDLVENLRSLELHPRVVMESGVPECYNYIKEQLKGLTRPSTYRSVLQNIKMILKRMLKYSNTYVLYLKHKREQIRDKLTVNFSVLVEELDNKLNESIQDEIIDIVEKQADKLHCYELIQDHLDDTQKSQFKEICRICQSTIRVDEVYQHVEYCQKRHIEKKNIRQNQSKIEAFTSNVRSKQAELQSSLKKRKQQDQQELPEEDSEKLRLKLYRKLVRYIEGQLNRSRFVTISTNQEIIALTDIERIYGRLRIIKEVREVFKQFNDLLDERKQIKNRLKKIDYKTQYIRETVLSLHSLHQQLGDKYWLARHNNSIKVIVTDDDLAEPHKKRSRIRKMHTYNQPMPSLSLLDDFCKEYYSERQVAHLEEPAALNLKGTSYCKIDFEVLKYLGKGAFGRVYLARRKVTRDLYAMKIVKLEHSSDCPKISDIMNQLGIFRKISGDYLVKAAFSFTQGDIHFFFLEYMEGGDFAALLDRETYLTQQQAKFYIAQIVLAIEHLHGLNIIHRDLKPQNMVLDSQGHLKLTDFGLSQEGIKIVIEQSSHPTKQHEHREPFISEEVTQATIRSQKRKNLLVNGSRHKGIIVGTPDYIAPEVLKKQSATNFTIDWWSLGVIVYEVLVGERPFGAQTVDDVFDNILHRRIEWPEIGYGEQMMTPEAKDLILKLLEPDYTKRLGCNGTVEIKHHAFFQGIDWNNIKDQRPPFEKPRPTADTAQLTEDLQLRKEIEAMMDWRSPKLSRPSLESLVRFDLLSQQTIRSGEITKRRLTSQLEFFNLIQQKCFMQDFIEGDCY